MKTYTRKTVLLSPDGKERPIRIIRTEDDNGRTKSVRIQCKQANGRYS
jgi:hypothetical protein